MSGDPLRTQAESRLGQVLGGKWRLDRLIGMGGMATVYAATHRNGRKGAVKILHPEMSANEQAMRRFLREGYAANKVDHPGSVQVLDDDVTPDGTVYLVMELLEGVPLDVLAAQRPQQKMSHAEAVRIAVGMLDVLEVSHKAEIIHRDLKPDNVFVLKDGQVKILDFGIARILEDSSHGGTQAGSLLGTPSYMPPEQALGEHAKVDARCDIWATGATLFWMLSGRPVHLGDTPNKVLLAAMSQRAPPLRSVAPDVSPALAAVVDKALAFDRDSRWASAHDMRDALTRALKAPNRTVELDVAKDARTRRSLHDGFTETPAGTEIIQESPSLPRPSRPPVGPPAIVPPPRDPESGVLHDRARSTAQSSALSHTAAGHRPSRVNPLMVGLAVGATVALGVGIFVWRLGASTPGSPRPPQEVPSVAAATQTSAVVDAQVASAATAPSSTPASATSASAASSVSASVAPTASAVVPASAAPSASATTPKAPSPPPPLPRPPPSPTAPVNPTEP